MSPKIVDREARRVQIAEFALDVFARHGFEVSVEKIAKAAKMGKGTIYQYYQSKTELILNSVPIFFQQISQLIQADSQEFEDPEERLRFEVKRSLEAILADKRHSRIIIGVLRLSQTNTDFLAGKDTSRDVTGLFVSLFRRRILEGISKGAFRSEVAEEAEILSMNLVAFSSGLWFHNYLDRGGFNPEEHLDFYLNRFFAYLRKRPSQGEGTKGRS